MILDRLNHPSDVNKLNEQELQRLCGELRWTIIKTTSKNGGHLASNLGSVELTVALIRALDLENDDIIWDVGHQAYAFKLLTGRYKDFHTLRKFGGISGYLKRSESRYDVFGAGHSSTSLSAAYGIKVGKEKKGDNGNVVAVIGDGALTSGIALEALNNIGNSAEDILIILNTNEMSISKNTGAIAKYLSKLITNSTYNKLVGKVVGILTPYKNRGETMVNAFFRFIETLKLMLVPGKLFESFNIRYFGPLDGHNVELLEKTIRKINKLHGPKILNVVTKKGFGYKPAYENPMKYHGVTPFNIETGLSLKKKKISCSRVFGNIIGKIVERDKDVIGITAAMGYGTGLDEFGKKFPDNFFDVGIEEEHAVTFAAGMAAKSLKPFVAIYSTFLQRAYDMIIHDVALQNLPVRFFLDRAGIVGDDGETHHGVFDLSYLNLIPNMKIIAPSDMESLERSIITAYGYNAGPIAVRYPRGALEGEIKDYEELSPLDIGKGRAVISSEKDEILMIGIGRMVSNCKKWASELKKNDGIRASVFDALWLKPIDEDSIIRLAKGKKAVVTVEDNTVIGGFGDAVINVLNKNKINIPVIKIGWQDTFPVAGEIDQLFEHYGIDYAAILKKIKEVI